MLGDSAGIKGIVRPHFVHAVGNEVVERNDADYRGGDRGRNSRIAYIGNVRLSLDLQLMDLRPERLANLRRRAREIDQYAAGIDDVDFQTVTAQPLSTGMKILASQPEPVSEFSGRNPVMKIGRALCMQLVNELL